MMTFNLCILLAFNAYRMFFLIEDIFSAFFVCLFKTSPYLCSAKQFWRFVNLHVKSGG